VIAWIFVTVIVLAAIIAIFAADVRRAILALWAVGLSAGGIYLSVGAELLAVIQWIVSTVVTIVFFSFSSMFHGADKSEGDSVAGMSGFARNIPAAVMAVSIGVGFAAVVELGLGGIGEFLGPDGGGVAVVGNAIMVEHLLSLEMTALTLFLALIGGATIARPEKINGDDSIHGSASDGKVIGG
jgi:NADH:ubiquinone oxidoreductase subunit 6 (subunit J)